MNITPLELEKIIQKAVEQALVKSFVKYLKFTIGLPLLIFLMMAVVIFVIARMNA
ncbi:hypothetical protein [Arsenophonus sp. ENCA]|uniref:hypothetical protein n=1 Tax=Arsenophonus sp. ENCA TaxID=1987579 RepID=UPI0025BBC6EF|nr:hypothetical protein [Arsenophonus sp. ENCA]